MDRIFKFRVWNKKSNKWVHGPGNEVNLFGEMILLGGFMKGVSIKDLDDCVVCQYTGLLDKNGKEIYEKDLVRVYDIDDAAYDQDVFKVYFSERRASFEFVGANSLSFYLLRYFSFEVVGNVFENKKLL